MNSMHVSKLLTALDEFRQKLIEHRDLWGNSLSQSIPGYAVRNQEQLEVQSHYLGEATGLTLDGAPLATQAFSVKNPMLAFSDLSDETKKNEQVGFMGMLAAFAKGVRNPLAHTHGKLEEAQKAFEYIALASLFCRRIDDASPKPKTPYPGGRPRSLWSLDAAR